MEVETNGCGAAKSWLRPPYGIFFKASCDKHDVYYNKGGSEIDRLKADIFFFMFMIVDTWKIEKRPKRFYYQLWSFIYFIGVRYRGHEHFTYKNKTNKK